MVVEKLTHPFHTGERTWQKGCLAPLRSGLTKNLTACDALGRDVRSLIFDV